MTLRDAIETLLAADMTDLRQYAQEIGWRQDFIKAMLRVRGRIDSERGILDSVRGRPDDEGEDRE